MTLQYSPNYNLPIPDFATKPWHLYMEQLIRTLDGLLFAMTGVTNIQGVWLNETAYVIGDGVVEAQTGLQFEALVDHTSSADITFEEERLAHPTYWQEMQVVPTGKGTWTTDTDYRVNDMVLNGYIYYVCREAHHSDDFVIDEASGKWAVVLDMTVAAEGLGDMLKSENLAGMANYATSRANLGVAINVNVQAYSARLSAIQVLGTTANRGFYSTANGAYAEFVLTSFARGLLDDAAAADMRTTLELGNSATKDVGTAAGTVMAGDDSRVGDAIPNTWQIEAAGIATGGGDGTADVEIRVAPANKDDMEAGLVGLFATTPGYQQHHKSSCKFWVYVTYSTGVPTLQKAYNVSSVTDLAIGRLTVTIANDFDSAYWAPFISYQASETTEDKLGSTVGQAQVAGGGQTADALIVNFYESETGAAGDPADPDACGIGGFGILGA